MTAEASFVDLLASVEAWEAILAEDDPRRAALRDELVSLGWTVEDSASGTVVRRA